MGRIIQFLKDWMLPVAIAAGILICLAMNCIGWLDANVEPGFTGVVKDLQPVLVALMLFLQFNKISPTDLRLKRWHLWLLLFQTMLMYSPMRMTEDRLWNMERLRRSVLGVDKQPPIIYN